jgi:prolyl oligopeptidase
MNAGTCNLFRRPELKFDPEQFVTRQVFYTSKDGTRVPMFICHKKGLDLDGNNPTYLYAYGGFKISNPPFYFPGNTLFMEMGGVFALANIRGGGEYGSAWHESGRLKLKQNSFDDFLSAAKWLVDNGYTSRDKLAIAGGSNGGLLVGACVTQQPDLFAAALPTVGVFDMLRFHKFTIGWAWTSEYGNPEDPEMFRVLYTYSPLHNVHPGTCYPAMLIRTADHDDRVVPSHSFKFTATLQAAQSCANPILLRVQTRAGHGRGTPTTMRIDCEVDKYAFLTRILKMDWDNWGQ